MIKVEDSVHSEMKSVGAYGESFSDIIAKCVRAFKEKERERIKK
jgi:predicted CopG family antitoxin